MSKHNWKFVRHNSKGEAIFRKDTNETLEFVTNYLDDKDIPYEICKTAGLIWIDNIAEVTYVYYWTTGRWAIRKANKKYKKHYHSKGIADFVANYLNKYADEQMTYYEDEHIACYSYPNCDISPSGCIVISGDNVERYGHRD